MTWSPGWYPDPWQPTAIRFWDGQRWTEHRAVQRVASAPPKPPHPTLPLRVGVIAMVLVVVPVVASRIVVRTLVDHDWPLVSYMLISTVIGYAPTLLWWRYVSRRWGAHHPAATVGLHPRRVDVATGPLTYLGNLQAAVVTVMIVSLLSIPLRSNVEVRTGGAVDRAYVYSLVVSAVLVAPVVEEIAFRGLALRGLLSRLRPAGAIAVQGVVFGMVHIVPELGAGNVGLVMMLSATGCVLGLAAYMTRRITPSIIAHAIQNSVAMAVLLHRIDFF